MLVNATLMLAMGRVKVVFNAVVTATRKFLCDVGPFVTKAFVKVKDFAFLFTVDRILLDVRVQVVMPPLTALFACTTTNFVLLLESLRYVSPAFGTVCRHKFDYSFVFLKVELAKVPLAAIICAMKKNA